MKKMISRIFDRIMGAGPMSSMVGLCLFSFGLLILAAASVHAAGTPVVAAPGGAAIDRYVIAISANDGGKDRPKLRYAESDAKSFAAVLKDMGGVEQKNVYLIQEPSVSFLNARLGDLDKILTSSKGKVGRDEVLVYYSGHADEKGLHLGEETYSWQEFRKRIDALNADVKIAVIDACGSGAITRVKGGVAVPAFMVDESSDMKGYAFITSSTQDEASQESDKLRGSFFTHSLVSGLRGAGDLSGDGKVTLSEAYQFAFNETLQKTEATMGGAQHPSRDMNLTGTGDVVMTDLRSVSAGMTLDESVEGRVFIRDDKGELVAELNKKAGRSMSLGLPAGNYAVRLEKKAELKEAAVALADGYQRNVRLGDFKTVATEKTVARGGEFMPAEGSRFDSLDHNGSSRTTFNFVDVERESRKGLMLGLFLTKSDDIMLGSQASLIGNIAQKEMRGLQVSMFFNMGFDRFEGLQLSSTFNYANRLDGVQIGSVNVVKNSSPKAVQVSAVNIAGDTVGRAQVGAVNLAGFSQVQVGAVNVAKNGHVQVGAVNVAKNFDDTQVATINVASNSKGRQWGIINVAGHADKAPVGLINIVGNGVWSVTGSVNEMNGAAVSVHLGTAYMYTAFETSRQLKKGFDHFEDVYENGFGFGTQFGKYGSHLELEYMLLTAADHFRGSFGYRNDDDDDDNDKVNFHHRLRLGGTARLVPFLGISAGLSLNVATEGYLKEIMIEPKGKWHDNWTVDGRKARFWPGLYAGVTLGRF